MPPTPKLKKKLVYPNEILKNNPQTLIQKKKKKNQQTKK